MRDKVRGAQGWHKTLKLDTNKPIYVGLTSRDDTDTFKFREATFVLVSRRRLDPSLLHAYC